MVMKNKCVETQKPEQLVGGLRSFDGYPFNEFDMAWKLNRNVKINLNLARKWLDENCFHGLVKVISEYAVNYSALHTGNTYNRYLELLRFAGGKAIDVKMMIAYRESLPSHLQYYLFPIRALLRRWLTRGVVGVDSDVVDMLKGWRIKGGIKGDAVKRLDLEQGPLSNIELQGLIEETVQAYEAGLLSINEASLLMLTAASARRPIQLTSLRLKDLYDRPGTDGSRHYFVNLPRAKQGGTFRGIFRELEITQELWSVLEVQREFSISVFKQYLGSDLPEDSRRELPLFFNPQALAEKVALKEFDQLNLGDFYHMHSSAVSPLLKRAVKVANVHSERTGEMLHIHARRLRYTLGCRAAREGYGVLVIAELLDHSDTQNAHVYTLNVPEHATRIDAAVGHQLAPYARAFAGVLVDTKLQARRGNIPGSDIRDFAGKGTGTCGHGGACGANVPVPCYTCPHFQPWLEGPHDLIYARLIEERDEVARTTADPTIAAVLDRTIVAVAEVIQACVSRKEQLRGAGEGASHD